MTKTDSILWFRKNLRIHDNPALLAASKSSKRLLCVFIYDEVIHYQQHGIESLGPYRAEFLWNSLLDLRQSLQALGNDLLILKGNASVVLKELVEKTGARTLYAPYECGYCERLQDNAIKQFCDLKLVGGATLLNINDLPTDPATLPNSYIIFRRLIEKNWEAGTSTVADCCESPTKLPEVLPMPQLEDITENPVADSRPVSAKAVLNFKGGEQAGLQRLNDFMWEGTALESYKQTRNQSLGSDYSSKLSPWIANGCLSARFVYHEIRRYEAERLSNESTHWMICELLWRDYYHFSSIKHGADLFLHDGAQGPNCSKRPVNKTNKTKAQNWCNAKTGQPFIDAHMTELLETGYMSNRGRQCVSAYFVRTLGLDWRLGASWFEHFLLDFEPCNNYGNWNFQAGIGHDSKNLRNFDVEVEAKRYDPNGSYQAYWLDSAE